MGGIDFLIFDFLLQYRPGGALLERFFDLCVLA